MADFENPSPCTKSTFVNDIIDSAVEENNKLIEILVLEPKHHSPV